MSKFDKEKIIKLADLAQLSLSEAEIDKFSLQLSDILKLVDQLKAVKIKKYQAIGQALNLSEVARPDQVLDWPQSDKDLALGQAEQEFGLIVVPKVR